MFKVYSKFDCKAGEGVELDVEINLMWLGRGDTRLPVPGESSNGAG